MISHLSTPASAESTFFLSFPLGTPHGDKFEKGRRKLLYKQLVTHHDELNFFLSKNKHFLQRYSCYIKGLVLIGGRKREDIKKISTETMEERLRDFDAFLSDAHTETNDRRVLEISNRFKVNHKKVAHNIFRLGEKILIQRAFIGKFW